MDFQRKVFYILRIVKIMLEFIVLTLINGLIFSILTTLNKLLEANIGSLECLTSNWMLLNWLKDNYNLLSSQDMWLVLSMFSFQTFSNTKLLRILLTNIYNLELYYGRNWYFNIRDTDLDIGIDISLQEHNKILTSRDQIIFYLMKS